MSVFGPQMLLPIEEDSSLGALSRDFLWDKLIVYLSTVSSALAVVDFLTNLLQGGSGSAVCYVPEELGASRDHYNFIQMFCSQRLPISQYIPIFFLLQGISIGGLHFLWKSSFSNHFNYFFSFSKSLKRFMDETGEYSVHNMNIVKKLKVEFSGSSKVFWYYQFKLAAQLFLVIGFIAVVIVFNVSEDEEFECPRARPQDNSSRIENSIWPFPGTTVNCVYLSHHLFLLISYVGAIILSLMLVILVLGLRWSFMVHPEELNITDTALFSYTTGLDSTFFVPNTALCDIKQCKMELRSYYKFICSMFRHFPYRLSDHWIQNDFEFFLMLLYRVDSGLAHACKEGLIQIEVSALTELDQPFRIVSLTKTGSEEVRYKLRGIATGWTNCNRQNYSRQYYAPIPLREHKLLQVPDIFRGYIMGLAKRALESQLAIDVSFGGQGLSTVLAQIFHHSKQHLETDLLQSRTPLPGAPDRRLAPSNLTQGTIRMIRRPLNMLRLPMVSHIIAVKMIYSVRLRESPRQIRPLFDNNKNINFMVIGPITEATHVGTAIHLIENMWPYYSNDAVLVIIKPLEIKGNDRRSHFHDLTPATAVGFHEPTSQDRRFTEFITEELDMEKVEKDEIDWEKKAHDKQDDEQEVKIGISLKCGYIPCKFHIKCYMYTHAEANANVLVHSLRVAKYEAEVRFSRDALLIDTLAQAKRDAKVLTQTLALAQSRAQTRAASEADVQAQALKQAQDLVEALRKVGDNEYDIKKKGRDGLLLLVPPGKPFRPGASGYYMAGRSKNLTQFLRKASTQAKDLLLQVQAHQQPIEDPLPNQRNPGEDQEMHVVVT